MINLRNSDGAVTLVNADRETILQVIGLSVSYYYRGMVCLNLTSSVYMCPRTVRLLCEVLEEYAQQCEESTREPEKPKPQAD